MTASLEMDPLFTSSKGKSIKFLSLVALPVILALTSCADSNNSQVAHEPAIIDGEIYTNGKTAGDSVHQSGLIVTEPVEYSPATGIDLSGVESPGLLSCFQDLEELKQWLATIEIPSTGPSITTGNTEQPAEDYDCDDFALMLQVKALKEGYIMSFEIIHHDEYNALFQHGRIPHGTIHAVNSVIIGNAVYYIEPKTREIVFVANLD